MSNIIQLIGELRKLAQFAFIVWLTLTVVIPAINTLLLVEQITNEAITATIETTNDYTCGYLWSCE